MRAWGDDRAASPGCRPTKERPSGGIVNTSARINRCRAVAVDRHRWRGRSWRFTNRGEPVTIAATQKRNLPNRPGRSSGSALADEVRSALSWLKRHATKRTRDGMARYAIPSDNALGVTMSDLKVLAKRLGRDHELAAALWETGLYEARMLAALVDEPARVTSVQMDRWCRDFDNWGIADTVCFALFDRTPYAWQKVAKWHDRR